MEKTMKNLTMNELVLLQTLTWLSVMFVPPQEQYKFCYEVALEALSSF